MKVPILYIALSFLCACNFQNGIEIKISPQKVILGENIDISISGLEPNTEYKVFFQPILDTDHTFYSEAKYISNKSGKISIDKDKSTGGDFKGRDSLGLFYSVRYQEKPLSYLIINNKEETSTKKQQNVIQIVKNEELVASESFEFTFLKESVKHIKIREKGIKADLFLANETENLIIVLGGSEGDNNGSSFIAKNLASNGFNTCAISYFGGEGQQKKMTNISLEIIDTTLFYIEEEMGKIEDLFIHGSSKGAELALLYASYHQEIKAVIAIAPSSVVLQSFNMSPYSTWFYQGSGVDFMSFKFDGKSTFDKYNRKIYAHYYLPFLEHVKEEAIIKVENIKGDILLFSGEDDLLWPSSYMANMIADRIQENDFKYLFKNYKYKDVGHFINVPYMPTYWHENFAIGGKEKENAYAQLDSWNKILSYLKSKSIENP